MSELPLITVVTATFNCATTLTDCFCSVAGQDYARVEHIIIDGASTDGTQELIQAEAERTGSRVSFWLSEPDAGIYDAWNKALVHIRGEWVIFVGADDVFVDSGVLAKVAVALSELPQDIRLCYGKLLSVDERGEIISETGRGWVQDRADFFRYAKQLPHTATFMRRAAILEHDGFAQEYTISADFELVCRELLGHEAAFVNFVIARHILRGVSVHPRTALISWRQTIEIIRKYKLPVSRIFLGMRIVKAWGFYLLWRVLPESFVLGFIDRLRRFYWKTR